MAFLHNDWVFNPALAPRVFIEIRAAQRRAKRGCAQAFGAVVILFLAGCASEHGNGTAQAPDWEDLALSSNSVTPPRIAAPPAVQRPATAPAPAGPSPSLPTALGAWLALQQWSEANLFPPFIRGASLTPPEYSVRASNGLLVLRMGSQSAYWNGIEVRLSFAPQMINDQPYLDALDIQKTIHPLLAGSSSFLWLTNRVIVIDPGHGGSDVGTRSVLDGHYEKEFTLDWALRLSRLLETNGWRVFLTRSNDIELAISNRVSLAETHKPALFLSLHFNSAGPNQAESGLETYCLTPAGLPSNLTREFADDLSLTFPNNAFDEQNFELALRVHRALLGVNGNHDRGVRRARFPGVLRGQRRPAVLIEGGYLSNQHEAGLIAEPAYRQRLAAAVAQALTQESKPPVSRSLAFHPELPIPSHPPETNVATPADGEESEAMSHNPELP